MRRNAYSDCLQLSTFFHHPPPVRYPEEEMAPLLVPRPAAGVHVGLCAVDIFCDFNKQPVNDILIQSACPSDTLVSDSSFTASSASPHHHAWPPAYQNSSDRRLRLSTPHIHSNSARISRRSRSTRNRGARVRLRLNRLPSSPQSAASRQARFRSSSVW